MSKNIESKDKYNEVSLKTRKQIFIDNFIGGMAWGLGSIIGATIIVGILGIVVINTKNIPLLGDVVKVVAEQVKNGMEQFKK